MAAYNVHAGRLFGSVANKTGILPFMTLADRVMSMEPYRSAARCFGSWTTARPTDGKRSIDRMSAAWPNAILIHLPVHASWLNQIEIVFSVIQRKVIKPTGFTDLAELADRLVRFEDRYNATATPFRWRFSTADMARLLEQLDVDRSAPAGQPAAA